MDVYVDWFYRQCATVLAPTRAGRGRAARARAAERRRLGARRRLRAASGRSAATRSCAGRCSATDGGLLVLSVGRLSQEKRLDVLLDALRARLARASGRAARVAGDGPARRELERTAPGGHGLHRRAASARSSRRSTRARTSSASRARPTRSARCCSRRAPPVCRSSPRRRAARSSSSSTGRTGLLVPPEQSRAFAGDAARAGRRPGAAPAAGRRPAGRPRSPARGRRAIAGLCSRLPAPARPRAGGRLVAA